jgi:hypothetical protein
MKLAHRAQMMMMMLVYCKNETIDILRLYNAIVPTIIGLTNKNKKRLQSASTSHNIQLKSRKSQAQGPYKIFKQDRTWQEQEAKSENEKKRATKASISVLNLYPQIDEHAQQTESHLED